MAPNAGPPDTVQWWIASSGTWRIRTFALDHDIHTHFVHHDGELLDLAIANLQRHYGDIVGSQHVIELRDCLDSIETNAALIAAGLAPRIEVAAGRFAFWKPDDGRYRTQSEPRK